MYPTRRQRRLEALRGHSIADLIRDALRRTGTLGAAAIDLNVSRVTLRAWALQWGIDVEAEIAAGSLEDVA